MLIFQNLVYIWFYRPTPVTNIYSIATWQCKLQTIREVRARYLLSDNIKLSVRIHCPKNCRFFSENSGGIETIDLSEQLKSKRNDKSGKFENIFQLIYNEKNLIKAWLQLKKNFIILPKIYSSEIIYSLSKDWFTKSSKNLKFGTYNYSNFYYQNNLQIKKESFSFQSSYLKDNIIQLAFFQILQPIWEGISQWVEINEFEYKTRSLCFCKKQSLLIYRKIERNRYYFKKWIISPIFLKSNYWFRSQKNVHSALKDIKHHWTDISWFLKFDIKISFTILQHHIVINEIERKISDQQVIDEIYKMFKQRQLFFTLELAGLKIPQESWLSAFFFNLYMHRLDEFMEELGNEVNRPTEKKATPIYNNLRLKKKKECDRLNLNWKQRLRVFRSFRRKLKRANVQMFFYKTKSQHIKFSRYAEDFIVGLSGSKQFVNKISIRLYSFLKCNLHLKVSKKYLHHVRYSKCNYGGFFLSEINSGMRLKRQTTERFERLKFKIKSLRKMEYVKYLTMLKEAEKRFWVHTLETSCLEVQQSMLKQKQIKTYCKYLSKKIIIDKLQSVLDCLKIDKNWNNDFNRFLKFSLNSKKNLRSNSRLLEAHVFIDKHWKNIIRSWIKQAKAVSSVLPEDKKLLLATIGEYKLKELLEVRKSYHNLLTQLDFKNPKRFRIDVFFRKQKKGCKFSLINQTDSAHQILRSSFFLELPYKIVKKNLENRGFIKNNKPAIQSNLIRLTSLNIIRYYDAIAWDLIKFYRCADNRWQLVKLINWFLRYSLVKTLAKKTGSTFQQTLNLYTRTPSIGVYNENGDLIRKVSFISPLEIMTLTKQFLVDTVSFTSNFVFLAKISTMKFK